MCVPCCWQVFLLHPRASRAVRPQPGGMRTPTAMASIPRSTARSGVYRYDARSWYYRQPRYYPYYASDYWVPRSYMRYRYRYTYNGPRYRYYPAWGYPLWGYSDEWLLPPVEVVTRSRHIHVL